MDQTEKDEYNDKAKKEKEANIKTTGGVDKKKEKEKKKKAEPKKDSN
jgi:hypothetical protein